MNFELAVDAVVGGDVEALRGMLRESPELVRARSGREHGATLLIYTAANGVEQERQKTPPNIVEIAAMLLDAGAEVDATANAYGGALTALGLAATSVHPEQAGVQEALLRLLLERGARLDGGIVNACLANGRAKAAEFLAARGAHLDLAAAAGLGRLEVLEEQLREGFFFACMYGRNQVVEFLLEKGVDLTAQNRQGQTALHCAVIGGNVETVKLLLRHKPPLEIKNQYGGTAMGQALWSQAHGGDLEAYREIVQLLAGAG